MSNNDNVELPLNLRDFPELHPEEEYVFLTSGLGFTYDNIRTLIKYFRFAGDEFHQLVSLPRMQARDLYRQVRETVKPRYIANFRYAIQFLIWERAIMDVQYREALMSLGDTNVLRSYTVVGGNIIPDNLDGYYCQNLLRVRKTISRQGELHMFLQRTPAELFGDIPTFDLEKWDENYAILLHNLDQV